MTIQSLKILLTQLLAAQGDTNDTTTVTNRAKLRIGKVTNMRLNSCRDRMAGDERSR
jgi:hypothetical protein